MLVWSFRGERGRAGQGRTRWHPGCRQVLSLAPPLWDPHLRPTEGLSFLGSPSGSVTGSPSPSPQARSPAAGARPTSRCPLRTHAIACRRRRDQQGHKRRGARPGAPFPKAAKHRGLPRAGSSAAGGRKTKGVGGWVGGFVGSGTQGRAGQGAR